MRMKSEVVSFPLGTAQGFPALRIAFDGQPFDPEKADAEVKRHAGAPGIWSTWLDELESWEAPELGPWIAAQEQVIAVRKLEDRDWPTVAPWTILDVSVLRSHTRDIDALAEKAAELLGPNPVVQDVVLELGHEDPIPMAAALDLLDDVGHPEGWSYLYAPADHRAWGLLLRAVSTARSNWALRRLP